ncbi:MAG: BlaI/MecI/CopY family transcriptional regulator [Gemmatimonadota bacterium]|nr:BlaI/MecI/CopY family transcriptional regulator [Gemmatimonadota bacterium]
MSALTRREMDVMAVLWDLGSATVAEVRERIDDDLAYNTVLTMLRILEEKGLAGREKHGRAHRYRPLLGRAEAGRSILGRLRDKVFSGSAERLMIQLVSEEQLSPEAVRRLQELLERQLADGDRPEKEDEK